MLRRLLSPRRSAARAKTRRLTVQNLEARDVPAPFTPGNIVVYRVGSGTGTLSTAAAPVFLDEYTPTGAFVQQVAMPTADSGANQTLTASGAASASEGYLNRTASGEYLVLTGYDAAVGTANVASSATTAVVRVIGRVGPDAAIDTTTTTTSFSGSSVRSAAGANGTGFWSVANATGVVYTPLGGSGPGTVVSNILTSQYRTAGVFGGQLYITASTAGRNGVDAVGTGLPTTAGQPLTRLPGLTDTDSSSPYGFFFADLEAGVPGVDTLYIADDAAGLKKFALVGGNWINTGTATITSPRGLTGVVSGSTVTLYVVGNSSTGGQLFKITDATGYNGTLSGTPDPLVTRGPNTLFRGVAMAPEPFNDPPVNTVQDQTTNEDVGIALDGLAVADPDAGSADIQVTFSVSPSLGWIHINDSVSGGVTAGQITGNDTSSVTLTAPLAAINATIVRGPFGSGIAYFPAANVNGPVPITMTTNDLGNSGPGGARTDTDTFTVTVFAVNDPPVNTLPANYVTNEDTPRWLGGTLVMDDSGNNPIQVTFSVPAGTLTVDTTIPNGVTAAQVSGNGTGTVVLTAPGSNIDTTLQTSPGVTYVPPRNFFGNVTLTMTTNDQGNTGSGGPQSDTDTSIIFVDPVNDPPVVTGATFTVNQNAPNGTVVGTVAATDVENDTIAFSISAGNTGGAFAIDAATGQITVANASAVTAGPFSLTVTATDNGSPNQSGSATVTVNVNTRPTISQSIPGQFSTEDGAAIVVDLAPVFDDAEDPDSALTFSVTANSDPSVFSSVNVSGATLTLSVAPDANGFSVLTVRATDTGGLFIETPFQAHVTAVNDAPTLSAIGNVTIDEDAAQQTVNLTGLSAGPADESGQTLTIAAASDNPALIPNPTITYTGGATGLLQFTPVADANGSATITVTVTDDGGTLNGGVNTFVRTFAVTVNAANDPPTLDPIADVLIDEDAGQQTVDLTGITAGPANESGQTVSFTATSDNPSLIPNPTVNYSGGMTGSLSFAPVSNASGTATITVTAIDTANGTTTRTFTITVDPVNDAPVVTGGTFAVDEHATPGTVVGTVTASDVEGDHLFFAITAGDPDGAFAIDSDTGVITVADDTLVTGGPFALTVEVTDDGLPNETGSAVVTVNINHAPTTTGIGNQTVLEGSGQFTIDLSSAFHDSDGDALTFTIPVDSDPGLFSPAPAITGTSLTFTPAPDAFGDSQLTVRATDTSGQFAEATFTVTVTAVNDAPSLDAIGNVAIDEDAPQQTVNLAGITAGPANESGQSLTITAESKNPALVPNPTVNYAGGPTGTLTFTPVADANGSALITVTVTDNGGTLNGGVNTFTRTFTVTVGSEEDRPVLHTAGTPMLPPEPVFGKVLSQGGLVSDLTENVTDADAGALKGVAIVAADTAKGKWQFNLTGDPVLWTDFPTDLSATKALLLSDDGNTRVRFVPKPLFNGFAGLTFKAWDQSNGAREGIDRGDTTDAADLSYSAAADRGWVTIGRTNPKVDADGHTLLPTVREDARSSAIVTVKNVLGIAGLEALPKTNQGIAITAASTADGKWQFRLARTTTWQDVGAVSDAQARLLRPTDQLRFLPAANADGAGTLTFKVWDQSPGSGGAGMLAPATGTAFGTDPGGAVLDIKPVNDAPVLDLSHAAVLNPVDAGGTTNAATFGSLMAATDVEAAAVGVAVFQASGPGTWHYRPAGGTDTPLPRVSILKALQLAADTEVWFVADPAAPAATARLSFRAWDRSNGKPAGSQVPVVGTAFSKQTEVLTVAIGNTKPVLDTNGSPTLPDVIAGTPPGSGTLVKVLLGTAVTDANPSPGIAITGVDNANGTWQYSLGLNVWVAVGAVTNDAALLLPATARIRFVPNPGFTGTATIQFKAWDGTAGITGDRIDTDSGLNSFSDATETATVTVKAA